MTIAINVLFYNEHASEQVVLRILPIVMGVVLTTAGDYNFSLYGTIICLLATGISCFKGIQTHKLQKEYDTMDLLFYNSAFAGVICLLMSVFTQEFSTIYPQLDYKILILLLGNGILAYIVNITSFISNRITSPLTMSISGNIKLVTTILVSSLLFKSSSIGIMNGIGIGQTFFGGIGYSLYKNKPIFPVKSTVKETEKQDYLKKDKD
jgi:hypothetical protein